MQNQLLRRELEKQMEENRTLLMRNLEVEDMFQNQTSSCFSNSLLRGIFSIKIKDQRSKIKPGCLG